MILLRKICGVAHTQNSDIQWYSQLNGIQIPNRISISNFLGYLLCLENKIKKFKKNK